MAAHTFWKGYLKLSLVSCRITLTPATSENGKIRFSMVNRATGHRAVTRLIDDRTRKPIAERDQTQGYEHGDGDILPVEDEDIESIALESNRTLDIGSFVPKDHVPWIWYDKPYWVKPADKVGEEAFSVIRAAMEAKSMVGISSLVLYRREQAVLVAPRGLGMIAWTLRHAEEVRQAEPSEAEASASSRMAKSVARMIKQHTQKDPVIEVPDPVRQATEKIISARRRKSKKAAPAEKGKSPSNVVNIIDALNASLQGAKRKN